MEAVQKEQWYFMVLLVLLPLLKVAVQQRAAATTVRLEEGLVLECLCPWDGNLSMVSWTKVPEKAPVAVFHPEFGVSFSHHYRERIRFLRTAPMDGSVAMTNVTHRDVGLYHCSVQTFPYGSWTRDILVEDSDELLEEEEEGTETPPPQVTEVDRELVAELGDNLTVSCNHEHNGTVYQVIMEKLAPGSQAGIMGVCTVVDGSLVGEEYSQRGRVSCSDSLDVSLLLTDLVEEDGGVYRCHFSTDAGVRTTTVLLTVPSPGAFSLSGYMMYIYFGAGMAGLALVVVIVLLALRQRKRSKREEYRVKLRPSRRVPNVYIAPNIRNVPCGGKGRGPRGVTDSPVYANMHTARHQTTAKR